jgi:hypothetical protein
MFFPPNLSNEFKLYRRPDFSRQNFRRVKTAETASDDDDFRVALPFFD